MLNVFDFKLARVTALSSVAILALGGCISEKSLLGLAAGGTAADFNGCIAGTAESSSSAKIEFEFPESASKVTLYRNGIPFYATTSSSATSIVDTGLVAGSTYRYNCEATFPSGAKFGSVELSVPMPAEDGLSTFEICDTAALTAATTAKVEFVWPAGASKITIRRNGTPIWSTTNKSVDFYSDTTLASNSTYQYTCEGLFAGNKTQIGTKDLYIVTSANTGPAIPDFDGCLTGTALSATSARITYEFPSGAEEVTLTRNGIPFYATRNSAVLSTDDIGLISGTTYRYNCKATFSGNREKFGTRELNVTTLNDGSGTVPDFEGCIASGSVALNGSQVKIRYQYPASAQTLTIFRDGVAVFSANRTTGLASDSAILDRVDSGLSEGLTYNYTCRATYSSGTTKFGTGSVDLTTISTSAPNFTGTTTVTPRSSAETPKRRADIGWAVPGVGVNATSFKIYYNRGTSVDLNLAPKATVSGSTYTYIADSLGDELTYSFAVRACATGTYGENCTANVATTLTFPDHGAPSSAGASGQKKEGGIFYLRAPWVEANGGVKRRKVYRVESDGSPYQGNSSPFTTVTIANPALDIPNEWIPLPSLAEAQTYYFVVRDSDAGGLENTNSAIVTINSGDLTPPSFNGKFTGVALAATPADRGSKMKVMFTALDPNDAVSYNIYIASAPTNACTAGVLHETRVASVAGYTTDQAVTTEISGLSPRTNYSFCVRAVDAAGNISTNNSDATRSTLDVTPPNFDGIQSFAYQSGPARLELGWNASDSTDIKEYRLKVWTKVGVAAPSNVQTIVIPSSGLSCPGSVCSKTLINSDYALTDSSVAYAVINACDNADLILDGTSNCTQIGDVAALTATVPDITPPQGFPGITSASSPGERQINVVWSVPSNSTQLAEYRGYNVYGYPTTALTIGAAEAAQVRLGQIICASNNCLNSFLNSTITIADAKRTYRVYMKAFDGGDNESATPPNPNTDPTVTTLDTTVPNFSSNLNAADPAAGTIVLTWSAATDNQYAQAGNTLTYKVYKQSALSVASNPFGAGFTAGSTAPTVAGSVTLLATTTSLTASDSSLTPGSYNDYTVCVEDSSGNKRCDALIKSKTINDIVAPVVSSFTFARVWDGHYNKWNISWGMTDVGTADPATLRVSLKRKIGSTATDWPDASSGTLVINNATGSLALNDENARPPSSNIAGINLGEEQFVNYTLYVSDNANPANQTIEHLSILSDNLAPVVAITSPANGSTGTANGGNVEITLSGTCETAYAAGNGGTVNAATVTLGGDVASPSTLACTGAGRSGTFSGTVVLTAGSGAKTVSVSQTDIGGNYALASRTYYPPLEVKPLYPTYGSYWMDYVKNDGTSTYEATDSSCLASSAMKNTDCLHGGEMKKVVVGDPSCSGLSLVEDLDAFEWECIVVSGQGATFVSKKIKDTKGLRDLVLGTEPTQGTPRTAGSGFRDNKVTITRSSDGVVRSSSPSKWWNNTVLALPATGNTSVASLLSGTQRNIYVAGSDRVTGGYNLAEHKTALVVLPGYTITANTGGTTCSLTGGNNSGGLKCQISGSGNYLWIEGGTWNGYPGSGAVSAGAYYNFNMANNAFVRARHMTMYDPYDKFFYLKANNASEYRNISFTINLQNGVDGIWAIGDADSVTTNVGNTFDGITFNTTDDGTTAKYYGYGVYMDYWFQNYVFKNFTVNDFAMPISGQFMLRNSVSSNRVSEFRDNISIENFTANRGIRKFNSAAYNYELIKTNNEHVSISNLKIKNIRSVGSYGITLQNPTTVTNGAWIKDVTIDNVQILDYVNPAVTLQGRISNVSIKNIYSGGSYFSTPLFYFTSTNSTVGVDNVTVENAHSEGAYSADSVRIIGNVKNVRLKNLMISRNSGYSIQVGDTTTLVPQNIVFQNLVVANSSSYPIYVEKCDSCTFQGISAINNLYGLEIRGFTNSVMQNLMSTNSGATHLTVNANGATVPQYDTFAHIVGINNLSTSYPLSISTANYLKWSGVLAMAATSNYRFNIAGTNTQPGLTLSASHPKTASVADSSDALINNLASNTSITNSFVGWIADSINQSDDSSGYAANPYNANTITNNALVSAFDFFNFENFYRAWSTKGDSLFATNSRGRILTWATMPLQIADYSLSSSDPTGSYIYNNTNVNAVATTGSSNGAAIQSGLACPTAANGNKTTTTNRSSGVNDTFLLNAWEVLGDGIGDDDGLCESNEKCIYTPNFGAYQGHGSLVQCTFNDAGGAVTGVQMWGYSSNGYSN